MRLCMRVVATILVAMSGLAQSPAPQRFWGQWRGPDSTGVSRTAEPPLEWSESKNVRWEIEIPGRGSSSPVVWGDRVYLMTAVPVGVDGTGQHTPRGGGSPRTA